MEPFETDLAFVVTVVYFNFDPSKSLPVLAIVKGQRRGLKGKKKKKKKFLVQMWKSNCSCPRGFGLMVSRR